VLVEAGGPGFTLSDVAMRVERGVGEVNDDCVVDVGEEIVIGVV
jgi:hypothetical protein